MYSPYAMNRKANLATGDIIVHISADQLSAILLPIPPLAEQGRMIQCIHTIYNRI